MKQLSLFNVVKESGDDTYIYNTLTSSFLKVATSSWKSLSEHSDKDFLSILYAQGILVDNNEVEIDKYKFFYYNQIFGRRELSLTIAPTMLCNFGCPYCFEGNNKNFPKMTTFVQNNVIKYILAQAKNHEINITWFGGEPLLAFDVILSISSRLNENNINYKADIITNGSLLKQNVIDNLSKLHLTHIQISLDGVGNQHDKTRHYKNGKPSFEDIAENIDLLIHKTDIKVAFQVSTTNHNPHSYEQVLSYMNIKYPEEVNKGRIIIHCNPIKNRTEFDKDGTCFTSQQLFRKDVYDFEQKYAGFIPHLPPMHSPCIFRSKSALVIDSKGFIYRCLEQLGQANTCIGNINKESISFSKIAELTFEEDPFSDSECIKCPIFPICGGGCPLDRIKAKREKLTTNPYCSYYKKYLADLLPYFYKEQMKAKR